MICTEDTKTCGADNAQVSDAELFLHLTLYLPSIHFLLFSAGETFGYRD